MFVRGGAPGTIGLTALGWGGDFQKVEPAVLATVRSAGTPVTGEHLPGAIYSPPDLRAQTAAQHRDVTFACAPPPDGSPQWVINRKAFDDYNSSTELFQMKLGTTEYWALHNTTTERHPFHIHVNPVQAVSINGVPQRAIDYRDTVPIPPNGTVVIRQRFNDYTGRFVIHCPEDHGMMPPIRVVRWPASPTRGQIRAAPDGRRSPAWRDPTRDHQRSPPASYPLSAVPEKANTPYLCDSTDQYRKVRLAAGSSLIYISETPMFRRLARIAAALAAAGAYASIASAISISGQVTAYSPGSVADPSPMGMAAGPDGNMWFTQPSGAVARMTTAGDVTEFSTGLSAGSTPEGIAAGPDGNMWVALNADNAPSKAGIARVTMDGVITEFRTGVTAGSMPYSITAGPDGNMWFTETGPGGNAVGRITPSGTVTEFQLPTAGENPRVITAGPDGNLWFTIDGNESIGRISPAGTITEFPLDCPTCAPGTLGTPYGITTGVDGNLWFTMLGTHSIGLITPDGHQAYEDTGYSMFGTSEIVNAPDGTLWFVAPVEDTVLRVNVFGGYSKVAVGAPDWDLYQMAAGPDGRMWIADNGGNKVRAITTGVGSPLSPYQFGRGLVGVQHDCGYAANTFGLPWTIGAVAYQWMLSGVPIAGATDSRFTPTSDQVGKTLACRVSPTYFPNLNQLGVTPAAVTIWAAAPAAAATAATPVLSLGMGAERRAHAGDIIRVSYVSTATGTAKVTLRFRGSRTASTLWTGTVRKGSHAMRVRLPKRRTGVASIRLATTSPAAASVSRGITIVR